MNSDLLCLLVELAHGEVDAVSASTLFQQYPKTEKSERDLYVLRRLGYISLLSADDEIQVIGVNQSAIDYRKSHRAR